MSEVGDLKFKESYRNNKWRTFVDQFYWMKFMWKCIKKKVRVNMYAYYAKRGEFWQIQSIFNKEVNGIND